MSRTGRILAQWFRFAWLHTRACAFAVALFVGRAFEPVKVRLGAWTYPEEAVARLAGVPVDSGFMYEVIGSQVFCAWWSLELRLDRYRAAPITLGAGIAIIVVVIRRWSRRDKHRKADLMKIAVAGGTGVVGRRVVEAVNAAGHVPIVLSRSRGVDITTGRGLATALEGADSVIDVSGVVTTKAATAVEFFTSGSRHLIEEGQRAGVRHHLTLSIVGLYAVDSGYYLGKQRQEEFVLHSTAAVTVLRATQFHEFAGQMLERVPAPLMLKMLCQPVAAAEVGRHLVELAVGAPMALAPEMAGPETMQLVDMVRKVLRARLSRRPVWPLPLPGAAGRAMRTGGLLPAGPGPRGSVTFDEWLAADGPPNPAAH